MQRLDPQHQVSSAQLLPSYVQQFVPLLYPFQSQTIGASAATHWLSGRQGSPGPAMPWYAKVSARPRRAAARTAPAPARVRTRRRREPAYANARVQVSNRCSSMTILSISAQWTAVAQM